MLEILTEKGHKSRNEILHLNTRKSTAILQN